MHTSLATLRQLPQPSPTQFLAAHPGCWIQYYDDTPAKDPAKALSVRSFQVDIARRKQQERSSVCFSLQQFGEARTKEGLLSYRNLGVDVDLLAALERNSLSSAEIDRRKEEYLARRLLPFPLKPHWLIETRHGFHAVFRILSLRDEERICSAVAINRRLVRALGGDENATHLTQVLRVPGTLQFKNPRQPFLCKLLMDHVSTIAPYDIDAVRSVLDALEVFHGVEGATGSDKRPSQEAPDDKRRFPWPDGLGGVPEGQRNATAAALIGGILGRLPERLWETAGWGGLKEWNQGNPVPLPQKELRSVFESIARREQRKRAGAGMGTHENDHPGGLVHIHIRIDAGRAAPSVAAGVGTEPGNASVPPFSPSSHADR